jgi:hypothetical protein
MFLQVFTAFGMPLQGASIQITPPEPVRYDDVNGFPSPNATVTGPVGTGYVFDGPVGVRLTVSASAPLQSFVPITTPPTESASVHIISLRSTR